MDKPVRAALYLRVSSHESTTENQRRELVELCAYRGWPIVEIYEDDGFSGALGPAERPAFGQMIKDAVHRKFDIIVAWAVDRLGRSLADLVKFALEMQSVKVGLYLHKQALDTTTPAGMAMYQMCGVFAEFERVMIGERISAGLRRAKAQGKKFGRLPEISPEVKDRIQQCLRLGYSVRKTASTCHVSRSSVSREKTKQRNFNKLGAELGVIE